MVIFFCAPSDISTHALTEGDTLTAWGLSVYLSISTHALTEGDRNRFGRKFRKRIFQLTPSRRATLLRCSLALLDIFQLTPSRRATCQSGIRLLCCNISTHALTEGDEVVPRCHMITQHFNSRPHGGRRFFKREINARFQFQLTPSRRATYARFITLSMSAISTHALTEGDRCTVHLVNLIEISTHALTEGDWTEQARED